MAAKYDNNDDGWDIGFLAEMIYYMSLFESSWSIITPFWRCQSFAVLRHTPYCAYGFFHGAHVRSHYTSFYIHFHVENNIILQRAGVGFHSDVGATGRGFVMRQIDAL